jgi:hypothetical protein
MSSIIWSEDDLKTHLDEMMRREPDRYLLRGQRCLFPTVTATLGRATEQQQVGQAYTILRQFVGRLGAQLWSDERRGAVTASREKVMALLQHYGWLTPFIDLTDNLDIAFFFAHDGYVPNCSAAMLVVDLQRLPPDHVHVSHDEVVDESLNLRWTRQRGHALRPREWTNMGNVREFDLMKQNYVQTLIFQPSSAGLAASAARRSSYYATDPAVAAQLEFLVRILADHLSFKPLDARLAKFPF